MTQDKTMEDIINNDKPFEEFEERYKDDATIGGYYSELKQFINDNFISRAEHEEIVEIIENHCRKAYQLTKDK